MAFEFVKLEQVGHVAVLTLNRPDKLNAIHPPMNLEIQQAFRQVAEDEEMRVMVITGAGRGFCAGGDVGNIEQMATEGEGPMPRRELIEPFGWQLREMLNFSKPLIAAVNGVAAGAALGKVLLCDIRIASEQARFVAVFVRRGLIPDGAVSYLLPKVVGESKACELLFTGAEIDAHTAKELGIVSQVVPHGELMNKAMELANKIASGPPIAIELTKRLVWRNRVHEMEEALYYETFAQRLCFTTEDTKEALRAFLEKRPPQFKGK